MRFLRSISTRHLFALVAAVIALIAATTAIAVATTGGGPTPPPRPLAEAIHNALAAPEVSGVSARITFTNHLIDAASVQGPDASSDPLLNGATGRLWATKDHFRLELQSNGGGGDSQLLLDRRQLTVYDSGSNTVYHATLPPERPSKAKRSERHRVPGLGTIQRVLARAGRHLVISGATPNDLAGQPAYSVSVSPRHSGGLLGGAELAWDAVNGVPLRAAIYAAGNSSPVLSLEATDISFGSVPSSVFAITPPAGARVVNLSSQLSRHRAGHRMRHETPVTGLAAVSQRVSFPIAAPSSLAGLPRSEVRLIRIDRSPAALITYGKGLGGVAVLEGSANAKGHRAAHHARAAQNRQSDLSLPKISINGTPGTELDTALGTLVHFQRAGVEYTVLGSVPPAAAEAAARGL